MPTARHSNKFINPARDGTVLPIHKLTYRRTNQARIHVRGYKEKGNINTPLELAIKNQIDRFNLVIDVIDRVPTLRAAGAHAKERMQNEILDHMRHAVEQGIDRADITAWTWTGSSP
jgi:xylulose-5-phosphate/fructose-6-phosphate phosphoketolase